MDLNRFKVPMKQWRKWSLLQQTTFNTVFERMTTLGPSILAAPAQHDMDRREFEVLAWNTAWTVADTVLQAVVQVLETKRV